MIAEVIVDIAHSEIDNINESLIILSANARSGSTDSLSSDIALLSYHIKHLNDIEHISIQNIF